MEIMLHKLDTKRHLYNLYHMATATEENKIGLKKKKKKKCLRSLYPLTLAVSSVFADCELRWITLKNLCYYTLQLHY